MKIELSERPKYSLSPQAPHAIPDFSRSDTWVPSGESPTGTDAAAVSRSNPLDQIHSFPRALAKTYGWKAAVILQFLAAKIAASKHVHDFKLWYYETLDSLAERFPYIHRATIHNILAKLTEPGGPLLKRRYNKHSYDRTSWYAFADDSVRKSVLMKPLYFSVKDAIKFGVVEAVLLKNIAYWVKENRTKKPDYTWHRLSGNGMTEHLPFSKSAINRALDHLFIEGELGRRPAGGFRKEYEYEILDETRLRDPNLDIDGPGLDMHGPNLDMHGPELDNNTYLKDTDNRHSLKRHSYQERQASPSVGGGCVLSEVTESTSSTTSGNRQAPDPCPAPPATAKGSTDSTSTSSTIIKPAIKEERDEQWASNELSKITQASYCYDPNAEAREKAAKKDRQERFFDELWEEQQERARKNPSPDKAKEGDVTLSAAEKVKVLRHNIIARNLAGQVTPKGRIESEVVGYNDRSMKAACRFFQANPDLSVEHLNMILDCCVDNRFWFPANDDSSFWVRRGTHLSFFFGHLDKIISQLDFAQFLPPINYLSKEEMGLERKPAASADIHGGIHATL